MTKCSPNVCTAPLKFGARFELPTRAGRDQFPSGFAHVEPACNAGYVRGAVDSAPVAISDAADRERALI
eukprot:4317212-Pyramimonas_sp.AAC.2